MQEKSEDWRLEFPGKIKITTLSFVLLCTFTVNI
jgi:hypothetical protein